MLQVLPFVLVLSDSKIRPAANKFGPELKFRSIYNTILSFAI